MSADIFSRINKITSKSSVFRVGSQVGFAVSEGKEQQMRQAEIIKINEDGSVEVRFAGSGTTLLCQPWALTDWSIYQTQQDEIKQAETERSRFEANLRSLLDEYGVEANIKQGKKYWNIILNDSTHSSNQTHRLNWVRLALMMRGISRPESWMLQADPDHAITRTLRAYKQLGGVASLDHSRVILSKEELGAMMEIAAGFDSFDSLPPAPKKVDLEDLFDFDRLGESETGLDILPAYLLKLGRKIKERFGGRVEIEANWDTPSYHAFSVRFTQNIALELLADYEVAYNGQLPEEYAKGSQEQTQAIGELSRALVECIPGAIFPEDNLKKKGPSGFGAVLWVGPDTLAQWADEEDRFAC